jgi:isoleucyl-tRNA synthetase
MVYYTLYNFCTVDLSALYLDVLKDRLYTSKAVSRQRRSAQTAMAIILETMMRLLAPILTFTAEEVWNTMPAYAGKPASVHLTQFPEVNPAYVDEALGEKWRSLIDVKGEISRAIETARKNKVIGHSLDAAVAIAPPEKLKELIEKHREDLRTLQIVSQLDVVDKGALAADPYESKEIEGLYVGVAKARGQKCNRCWIYSEDLGKDPEHPTICGRCLTNIK